MDDLPSATQRVIALPAGEAYSKAIYIPARSGISPKRIKNAKRRLLSTFSKIVARANGDGRRYRMSTVHAFTEHYDLVVVGVIVREEDEL